VSYIGIATFLMEFYRYSLAFAVVVILFLFKRLNSYHKALGIYLGLMLLAEISSSVIGTIYKNNHIVMPFYALSELLFFCFFYKTFFLGNKFTKFFLPPVVMGVLFIVYELMYNFILHSPDPHTYQPYSKTVDNTIILAMAFSVLNVNMSSATGRFGWNGFWFNIIVVLFFTYNTIFFLPFNFMVNAPMEWKFLFWMSNTFSIIGFYGYLTVRVVKYAFTMQKVKA
jgi:hypothetical protein